MKRLLLFTLAVALLPACVWAVDGQILINQAAVTAAGGFPYKITQPGSYKLSGNLTVATYISGIVITSDNVTLDLNGFSITGAVTCRTTFPPNCTPFTGSAGVLAGPQTNNITVRNGVIQGFSYGLLILSNLGNVSDIQASKNAMTGLDLGSGGVTAVRCQAYFNGNTGIMATSATISDSVARMNPSGFSVYQSVLTRSLADGNQVGIQATRSLVTNNVSANNDHGFWGVTQPWDVSLLGNNTFTQNGDALMGLFISQNNNLCSSGSC